MSARGILCGNHQGVRVYHVTTEDVRACYDGKIKVQVAIGGKVWGPGTFLDATDKQLRYVRSLVDTRDPRTAIVKTALAELDHHDSGRRRLSKKTASDLISRLNALPKHSNETASRKPYVTEDGMYQRPDGEIYKVQYNKANGSGRALYAKKLVRERYEFGTDNNEDAVMRHKFVFMPGLIAKIDPSWKMTKEQAQAFGQLYGICVNCLRDLTDENSIAMGMGPICAGKRGWA